MKSRGWARGGLRFQASCRSWTTWQVMPCMRKVCGTMCMMDPSCGTAVHRLAVHNHDWALPLVGIDKMYSSLGMQSPFLGAAGVGAFDPGWHTFRRNMGDAYKRNWAGPYDSPRTAPSARAKSCTYLRWFARPGKMPAEPYSMSSVSFPSRFPNSGDWCSSGRGPMTCQLSRAEWQGL